MCVGFTLRLGSIRPIIIVTADSPKAVGEQRMARKIRELIRELEHAGFINRGGKGDHRNFEHSRGGRATVSGQLGEDAKPYQEREVRRAIEESQQ